MLGLGFLAGGLKVMEQSYNEMVSGTYSSLLILAVAGLIFPTASQLLAKPLEHGIVRQSRGTAIVFIVLYMALLYFQLRTHKLLFAEVQDDEEEDAPAPKLTLCGAFAITSVTTTLIGFHTYFATNNLEEPMNSTGLTKSFVGVVLIPLFTNDPEPIMSGWRNDMDTCLQATIGKCIQTVLFVIPIVVLIGWGMGIDEMSLEFDGFEVAALFASVLYINFLTGNGKSNW